jgi:hypothetical protein
MMRIIKLSPRDIDFPDRVGVDTYFEVTLPNRNPIGQFLLTQGRIAEYGIEAGELIIFSYKTEDYACWKSRFVQTRKLRA